MTEEQKPNEGQGTPPAAPAVPSPPAAPVAAGTASEPEKAPQTPSWLEELEKADSKELRKHPKIAGLIGSEAQQLYQQRTERERQTEASKARDAEEKAFLDLVEGNTDYIRDNHPLVYKRYEAVQQERATREVQGIEGKTVAKLAESIGRALADVPEWKELKQADHEELAKAVMGKPDDEVLPIFNKLAIDLVAKRRTEKAKADWIEKEIPKLRESIRQEEAARLLRGSDAPDLTPPKGPGGGVTVKGMSASEFDKLSPPGESMQDMISKLKRR